jgi:hypothetical protein
MNPPADVPPVVAVIPLHRLTAREMSNTVLALFGAPPPASTPLPGEGIGANGYESATSIGTMEAEAYQAASEAVAADATTRLPSFMPCTPATAADEQPCAVKFIDTFGRRAYRRPLLPEESADLLALYTNAHDTIMLPFADSIGAVMQALIQSASFLYHREIGPDAPVQEGDDLLLTNFEIASRLSYFITGGPPDDTLLDAATSGDLTTPNGLNTQAQRLAMNVPQVAGSIADFSRQWLELDTTYTAKDPMVYPNFDSEKPQLLPELRATIDGVLQRNSPLSTLLTDPSIYVNDATAPIYGVPPPGSMDLVKVTADATQRAGIFTQLAFLSVQATAFGSHPVKRGKIIFKNVICGVMGSPPANVAQQTLPRLPTQTTRQYYEQHEKNPCASCHKQLDPPGFAFENFDGIGQWRTTEIGQPVDASGSLDLPSGTNVTFQNAVQFMTELSAAPDVEMCFARQLARYGTGLASDTDLGTAQALLKSTGTGASVHDLYLALVQSRSFRYRKLADGETL